MDCKITEDKLLSYTLNELNIEEQLVIENHIADCQRCQLIINEFNELHEAFELPTNLKISEDFSDKLMAELPIKKTKLVPLQSIKFKTFYNFTLTSAATFLFIYFDFFNILSNFFSPYSPTFINTKNSIFLATINSSMWLDKVYYQILNYFQ